MTAAPHNNKEAVNCECNRLLCTRTSTIPCHFLFWASSQEGKTSFILFVHKFVWVCYHTIVVESISSHFFKPKWEESHR